MLAVIFEVIPAPGRKQQYLELAAQLRPELEKIDGFISVERFASLTNENKLLSLSFWRDEEAVRTYTETLQAWRRDYEARPVDVTTEALAGYVDVLDGRPGGLVRIQQAVDDSHVTQHAPGQNPTMVRILLEACLRAPDPGVGLAAAELRLGAKGGAALWEAEFRRLRAEFLAILGAPAAEIEGELEGAAAVAGRQGARSLELRTAASLLRHRIEWGDARGVRDARERLAALLDALPEPHASRDRDEAEALLVRQ